MILYCDVISLLLPAVVRSTLLHCLILLHVCCDFCSRGCCTVSHCLLVPTSAAATTAIQAANDKNDPVMVDTYRRLKTLRAKFEELIGAVGRIGQQEKAVRDLETKIDQEQARVSANNIDRIRGDLDAIAKENAQLVAQIKAASAGKHK